MWHPTRSCPGEVSCPNQKTSLSPGYSRRRRRLRADVGSTSRRLSLNVLSNPFAAVLVSLGSCVISLLFVSDWRNPASQNSKALIALGVSVISLFVSIRTHGATRGGGGDIFTGTAQARAVAVAVVAAIKAISVLLSRASATGLCPGHSGLSSIEHCERAALFSVQLAVGLSWVRTDTRDILIAAWAEHCRVSIC